MTRNELSYIAGIVDGEGYIGLIGVNSKYNREFRLRLTVDISNKNSELMRWLSQKLNYRHRQHTTNKAFIFRLTGKKAISLLEKIYPYLIIKKKQANLAMRYFKTRLGSKEKSNREFFTGMKLLRKESYL